jgi:hypothetical protein
MISPELERRIRDSVARWNRGDHTLDPAWTDPEWRSAAVKVRFVAEPGR